MPKIILIGGSSEIGMAIAMRLMSETRGKFQNIIRISTSLSDTESIFWDPKCATDVDNALEKVEYRRGDLVIIAVGKLSGTGKAADVKLTEIEQAIHVNLEIPTYSLIFSHKKLEETGGGSIILLSSAAAFPTLGSNLFYGASKNFTDKIARHLQADSKNSNVGISIVRSGYVQTKLNRGRVPTPFALSADEVGKIVSKKNGKKVIWTPWYFVFISNILSLSKTLQKQASKKITESMQN